MKTEIKHRFTNEVIHSFDGTIKECVEDAVKKGISLAYANLESANLRSANLRSADLYSANLYSANLESANLESANLESANLYSANLRSADLYSANLYSANLYSANLESANLRSANLYSANLESANLYSANKVPIYCKWSIGITNGNLIHIGCEKRTIEEWDAFFASDKELSTKRNTPEFKQIEAVYLAYKSYLTHLQS